MRPKRDKKERSSNLEKEVIVSKELVCYNHFMKCFYVVFLLAFLTTIQAESLSPNSFEKWKEDYIKRAAKKGIPSTFSTKILSQAKFLTPVLDKQKSQVLMDENLDYNEFMQKWLRQNPSRIETGLVMLKEHQKLLENVEKVYGVDKEVIVALWGVETFYGKIMGDYNLVDSLATLAYQGRRKSFFEIQLNAVMRILLKGHAGPDLLKGSWAGATGQCQFMPSNFNLYAQDFDKDGKKDIWTNHADIFASIAYFLKKTGWKKNQIVGELVNKPVEAVLKENEVLIPLKNSPVLIKGPNYRPLIVWNRSSLFVAFNILLMSGFQSSLEKKSVNNSELK